MRVEKHHLGEADGSVSAAAAIALALGGTKAGLEWKVRCICHDDRTPSLFLRDGDNGQLLVRCFAGCSGSDILRELGRRGLDGKRHIRRSALTQRPDQLEDHGNVERAMRIWREGVPLRDTLGQIYLDRRGLALPVDCVDIRFHPRCPRQLRRQPAVVMLLRDIHTNEPRAIQRRFLLLDGTKDGKAMSLGPCGCTVLKLSPDEDVTLGLALAEGHADALAVIGDGWRPCWATCGVAAMASFPVLRGIEALTIFSDPNAAGQRAAETCRARWRAAGKEVRILPPPDGFSDFGDVAQRRLA
jgi:putative DNA primase/helicase